MKTTSLLAIGLISLSLASALGQPQPGRPLPPQGLPQSTSPSEESKLTKFNLDFPGGTPQELVRAIQKATSKPLNAIIPDEHAQTKLPPLKMSNVDVQQLFRALGDASLKSEAYVSTAFYAGYGSGPSSQWQIVKVSCGFRTQQGQTTDDSIWYFYVEKPVRPPDAGPLKSCRFYALSPYLEGGLTVDDITTAIQTGWKMLGDTNTPTINYHKDTKLLIAVGEPTKLETIDAVLKALTPPTPPAEKKSEPKPAEKKAEK